MVEPFELAVAELLSGQDVSDDHYAAKPDSVLAEHKKVIEQPACLVSLAQSLLRLQV